MNVEGRLGGPEGAAGFAQTLLSPDNAAAAVRRGIMRAAKDFERWSDLWPSERGCENLLQVRAAEELYAMLEQDDRGWLTLEEPLSSVGAQGSRRRGRPSTQISEQQRADIAIWSKSDTIYALVEIKRAQRVADWVSDVDKLCLHLKAYATASTGFLRFGVFGAYIAAPKRPGIGKRFGVLERLAAATAAKHGLIAETTLHDLDHRWDPDSADDWTCAAASVELTFA